MLRLMLAFLLLSSAVASACFIEPDRNISAAMEGITSPDPAVVGQSIERLRGFGPSALQALLTRYDAAPDPKLIPAIEAVAAQRGAFVSRLFWYTDVEKAKAAAKAENKPILYLRMMGKLTDEYSCANSRFFRTVLYANTDVSRLMRENFVLVWVSERPVPIVTIDYGDGRVLKRTLTGNSIHYILDSDGRVIDALPGLYAPRTFAAALKSAGDAALSAKGNGSDLAVYLQNTDEALVRNWQSDSTLSSVDFSMKNLPNIQPSAAVAIQFGNPPARAAMQRAVSKTAVESPIIAGFDAQSNWATSQWNPDRSIETADAATWEKIATLHLAEARLDAPSLALIRSQNPRAYTDTTALNKLVEHFQKLIALDTVHNNYQLRRTIIAWLRQSPEKMNVEDLNARVYSELFLTPRTDPWLGLAPDEYTALGNDGCFVARK